MRTHALLGSALLVTLAACGSSGGGDAGSGTTSADDVCAQAAALIDGCAPSGETGGTGEGEGTAMPKAGSCSTDEAAIAQCALEHPEGVCDAITDPTSESSAVLDYFACLNPPDETTS